MARKTRDVTLERDPKLDVLAAWPFPADFDAEVYDSAAEAALGEE